MKWKEIFLKCKDRLQALSFRTGVIVLALCAVCYILAFAQMALPISIAWKGGLWVLFFGLAKTFQYSGILIIGKEGLKRLKRFRNKRIEKI